MPGMSDSRNNEKHSDKSPRTAVVIVDHGSRRSESNDLLLEVVAAYRAASVWAIVEPAHMELAEPSLSQAFARCVAQGASRLIVFPYFLSPGRHWDEDIPRLAAEAAAACGGVEHIVTAPLGLHPLMMQIIDERIAHCLRQATAGGAPCDVCAPETGCQLLAPDAEAAS